MDTPIELQVSGMTCGSCVASVTRILQRIPGVNSVAVDLAAGRAQVLASGEASAGPGLTGELVAALHAGGYPAAPAVQEAAVSAAGAASSGCAGQGASRPGGCCCGR